MDDKFFSRFGGGGSAEAAPSAGSAIPSNIAQPQSPAPSPAPSSDPFAARFNKGEASMEPGPGESPSTAINISPEDLTIGDRMKTIGLGNAKGSINYLKQKYEDVKYNPDKGLVVKSKGIWRQVDPSGWGGGDAWDKTKEIVKDAADLVDVGINAVGVGVGTALGGAIGTGAGIIAGAGGGLPGMVAGAAAGSVTGSLAGAAAGGAASGYIRTSLGRLAGTYEATDEERLKDIGLESILSLGGEAVSLGMKPTINMIKSAVTKFTDAASDASKSAAAGLLSVTSPVQKENAARLFDRSTEVMGALSEAQKSSAPIPSTLKNKAIGLTKNLLEGSQAALSGEFDSAEKELLSKVPATFTTDAGAVVNSAMTPLVDAGLIIPKRVDSAGKVLAYKIADEAQMLELLKHPDSAPVLGMQAVQTFNKFLSHANTFLDAGEMQGQEAASFLMNTRRLFDKFYFNSVKANPDIAATLSPATSSVKNALVDEIKGISEDVAKKYISMNEAYRQGIPHVAQAERIMSRYTGPESLVNALMSDPGKNESYKNMVKYISNLKGESGQAVGDKLMDNIAANDFIRIWPQISLGKAATATGAGLAAAHYGMSTALGVGALAVAPLTSPRLVGRTVQAASLLGKGASSAASAALPYAQHLGDFLKSIPPEQMKNLVASPEALQLLVRSSMQGFARETQMKSQLLNQAGIPSDDQQQQ